MPGLPAMGFHQKVVVDEEGWITFAGPQGEVDLRFAAVGWTPLYRWGLEVGPEAAQLGALRFERGSSVSGFVRDGSTELPLAGAVVIPFPASVDGLSEDARRRLEAFARGVPTNESGFFQLTGLPPGRYRLEFELEGFFPTQPPVVEVLEESESHLSEPIDLVPAIETAVYIEPRLPLDEGDAGPWQVELIARKDRADVRRVTTDEQGAARFDRLAPGVYTLSVSTERHPAVWREDLELSFDRVVTIELPLVQLVGELTLGGEPLVARIAVGTGARDQWRYRSDEKGRFGGLLRLPEHDVLFVRIEADEPELEKELEIREVTAEHGVLELALSLDDRIVEGTVVDGLGEPVEGAEVSVYQGARLVVAARTDGEGNFIARGLERGRYRMRAKGRGRGASEAVEADLSFAERAGPFRLTLVPQRRLDGVLRTADGRPVQGARIEAHSWHPVPLADVGRTDLAGRFWIYVPEGAQRTHLEIEAPSVGLIGVCATFASPEEAIEVELPSTTDAALWIDLDSSADLPPATLTPLSLLRHGGGLVRSSTLRSWGKPTGDLGSGEYTVQGIFPGDYALAWIDGPFWYAAASVCERTLGREPRWQSVGPGQTLRLRYDVTPHQRATLKASSR